MIGPAPSLTSSPGSEARLGVGVGVGGLRAATLAAAWVAHCSIHQSHAKTVTLKPECQQRAECGPRPRTSRCVAEVGSPSQRFRAGLLWHGDRVSPGASEFRQVPLTALHKDAGGFLKSDLRASVMHVHCIFRIMGQDRLISCNIGGKV